MMYILSAEVEEKEAQMLCDRCKKNEATIHVKKVTNGKIEAIHLCAECAREDEEQGQLGALGFNLAEVLFNIGGIEEFAPHMAAAPAEKEKESFSCPDCGWTMEKLQKSNGMLGCPGCYKSFAPVINDAFARIQRGKVHLGKKPGDTRPLRSAAALRLEIARGKKELAELVRREEYERAAVCRDKINELNRQLESLESAGDSNE